MNSPSLLPPRGIFVPTRMIFNQQLPAAVLVTWIQLRCLAWMGWTTPPLSLPELASLTGIHPARLNRHLSQLADISALTCRSAVNGKIIISFPEEPTTISEKPMQPQNHTDSQFHTAEDQGVPDPPSYFPHQIMGYLTFQEDLDGFSDEDILGKNVMDVKAPGMRPCEVENDSMSNQDINSELVSKLRRHPAQVNQHGGHAYP